MARVASNSFGFLHETPPRLDARNTPQRSRATLRLQSEPHRFQSLRVQAKTDPVDPPIQTPPSTDEPVVHTDMVKDEGQTSGVSQKIEFAEFPNKDINRRIALASTVAAVGLYLSTRLEFGVSLKDLSAAAVPYEVALSNGMPTVVEFYADWCEVCRELTPDIYKVEQQYRTKELKS